MELTLKCRAVSNYIIEEMDKFNKDKEFKNKVFFHAKRLNKILYFCEIEYMKRNNGKILFLDNYNAWPSGPVIPSIYTKYMVYVDSNIKPRYKNDEPKLTEEEKKLIDYVLEATMKMDTIDLVNLSTMEGAPFNKYFNENDIEHKQIIPKDVIYNYYKDKVLFPIVDKYLYQDEIIKLEDKDLQLRYILGGLYPHGGMNCSKYWGCDIKCSTKPVEEDDRFLKVKNFIIKHNISNATFLRLARTYLSNSFMIYDLECGNLILELDSAIRGYDFVHTNDKIDDNDLKEKELLKLVLKESDLEGSKLNLFLNKYSLTKVDFMILAKTSINYQFKIARGFVKSDLFVDLYEIIDKNNMYQSYEFVKNYRENVFNKKQLKKLKKIKR